MAKDTDTVARDRANVLFFPPAVGAVLAIVGIALHFIFPIPILPASWLTLLIGIAIFGFGVALQVMCVRALKGAQTTPLFKNPTTGVLQQGPYSWSRNPIYVAVLFQFLGLALIVNTVWLLVALLAVFVYLHLGVIPGEERYLEQKFGDEYRAYRAAVRPWV